MVREVLRELLPQEEASPDAVTAAPSPPDVRRVRVRDDRDLADLVSRVLDLAAEPARAADLRSGRIRFVLEPEVGPEVAGGGVPASTRPREATTLDVDRGAVTERVVLRAAREQRALQIGPRAVVTPLARDRARALGVSIERREAP
jgi:hypothetical protein